jgi:hypothetical protein
MGVRVRRSGEKHPRQRQLSENPEVGGAEDGTGHEQDGIELADFPAQSAVAVGTGVVLEREFGGMAGVILGKRAVTNAMMRSRDAKRVLVTAWRSTTPGKKGRPLASVSTLASGPKVKSKIAAASVRKRETNRQTTSEIMLED